MAIAQPEKHEPPVKLAFRIEGHTFASQEEFLGWHRKTASTAKRLSGGTVDPEPTKLKAGNATDVLHVAPVADKVKIIRLEDYNAPPVRSAPADASLVVASILGGLGVILAGGYLAYRMGQRSRSQMPNGYPHPHDESWYTGDLGPMDLALTGGDIVVL